MLLCNQCEERDCFYSTSVMFDIYLIGLLHLSENELNEEVCLCVCVCAVVIWRCYCENMCALYFLSLMRNQTLHPTAPVTSSMPPTYAQTFNLHPLSSPSSLPSLLSFDHAARSEAQKGGACFSNLGTVVMLCRWSVVTVVTVAPNGLAAAWQPDLITHLPMIPHHLLKCCLWEWTEWEEQEVSPVSVIVPRPLPVTWLLSPLRALVCWRQLCTTRPLFLCLSAFCAF